MLDEEKNIDVGEADEQETTIDLDAPAVEPVEEEIQVEETSEEEVQAADTTEKPKDELGEYSEGVQKRIAKLTRKMREAERQKEEAIQYAKTIQEKTDSLKNRYEKLDSDYTQEFEKRVTTNIDAVKQKLAIAINSGDVEGQVAAQSDLAQLTMDATKLARIKDLAETTVATPATTEQPVRREQPKAPLDPQADAWASKNPWFGSDNAMTYTAFDIHKNLVEEEGYDPNTTEYYTEVDKRIRVAFPNKFANVEQSTSAPVQNVASAHRPAASKGRRKTVKLTPSQVAISKRLGVPLEEYAKQLAAKEV